ncbi:MAG: DUF790 family protein [Bradymonadales bacterium]|jgi:predicted nuclease of restriction endonuclease-like RecB superfamily
MLPKNLLRSREDNHSVFPLYITASPSIVEALNTVLDIFRASIDDNYENLIDDINDLCSTSQRHRLLRGLCHLLEQRLEFYELSDTVSPEELRERIFLESAAVGQEGYTKLQWRNEILQNVAKTLGLSANDLEELLYCDLKGQRKIKSFEDLEDEELIARYNLSLAQTVLFRAKSLDFELKLSGKNTAPMLRKIFSALKFHGLLFELQVEGELYKFSLDGPNALFSQAQKYGVQLAAFLPMLFRFKDWEAKAKVLCDANRYKDFVLSPADFDYPLKPLPMRLPEEQERLIERLKELAPDWLCEPNPQILELGGQQLWIPDFSMEHRLTKRRVHIEIIGFWRSDYLRRRLKLLKTRAAKNLILILSDKLKVDREALDAVHPQLLFYKSTVRPQAVLKLIEACAL